MQDRTAPMQKTSLGIGDVLNGRYIIEKVIDRGGMGIVLGGRHIRLDKRVAIKILLPETAADPTIVARFIREGRMLAQIGSNHVVHVEDVDVTPAGMAYLVMEWLDGQDLKSFCKSRKTDSVEVGFAVRCILEACDGLEAAHALGIVHRDIKPSNLFLTRGPRGAIQVKIIDFGISKQDHDVPDERTKTGTILGTTEYMGPEQIRSANRVDGRADIWALGVTLYKLVTGRLPFRASDPIATCALILGATPAPPTTLRAELPPGLETIILKCLQKNPEDRYKTVNDLARALAPFAEYDEKTVVLDPPPPPTSRTTTTSVNNIQAKPSRRRAWSLLGAVVMIAVLGTLTGKINRAEATVPKARRIAEVWQAPNVTIVPPRRTPLLPSAFAAPEPTRITPKAVPRPTATTGGLQPRKTPTTQTEAVATKIVAPQSPTNLEAAQEDTSHTPESLSTAYGF